MNARLIIWFEKNKIFQPTIKRALSTKREITTPNFFSEEYLFHIIRIEREVRTKIIVHIITIIELEGVQPGRLIVLYQDLPVSAKYEAAEAVIITKSGMKKKFGFNLAKVTYPNIFYRHWNKKRKMLEVKHLFFPLILSF